MPSVSIFDRSALVRQRGAACSHSYDCVHCIRYGCEPTKATFDSALEVYSHTGSVAGSVRWLQAMCAIGIRPDDGTFRWVKRACTRASSVAEAEWCFNVMIECGLIPDVGAFTAVVNVCAHIGDVTGAEKWFSAMQLAGIWPGAIAYNSVINAHAQVRLRCSLCTHLRLVDPSLIHTVQSGLHLGSYSLVLCQLMKFSLFGGERRPRTSLGQSGGLQRWRRLVYCPMMSRSRR